MSGGRSRRRWRNWLHPAWCRTGARQLRPESLGQINIRSADPHQNPAIVPNCLSHQSDCDTVVAALKLARRIADSPSLGGLVENEYMPGGDVNSDEELLEFARETGVTIFHPTGTCKMGSDELSVVDQRLKVHGVRDLRVVDASIMPLITSGNTNARVIMIAEKASDMIHEDAERS